MSLKKQWLIEESTYYCLMHSEKIRFKNGQHLMRHLCFMHPFDDQEDLLEQGIHKHSSNAHQRDAWRLRQYEIERKVMQPYEDYHNEGSRRLRS